jgi:hypothetical protein
MFKDNLNTHCEVKIPDAFWNNVLILQRKLGLEVLEHDFEQWDLNNDFMKHY